MYPAMASTEFTAENVEKAVNNFYCNASLQEEVHRWLTTAQISQEAWSFSWELLAPNKSVQVQFFGASCLHVKINRFWTEIPPEQYESLRSNLLEQIINFRAGPKLILTRLCIALSSFTLHSMPDVWKDPIPSLISIFQDEQSPLDFAQRCNVLLEVLTVLPEEFFSSNLSQSRRGQLRHELCEGLSSILGLLKNLMSPGAPADVYEHALKCFSSWVEFGIPMNEAEDIILQVFNSLQSTELFDTAVDTLVGVFSHPDAHRFPYTIQKLLPVLLQLHDMLNKAINEQDMDICQGVANIVVSLAENHTKMILECSLEQDETKKSNMIKLTHLVLACTSVPGFYPTNEQCSSMTFTFWYILQDNLLEMDVEQCRQLLPIYQPVYLSLIENLLVKVQYPPDEIYDTWSADEKEQFRCYRQDIGDTMMYAYSILREPLLGHLCNALAAILQTNKEVDIRWQLMEAIFFLFGSVAENVDLEESLYIPSLLELLPKIPFNNTQFISTALYMIGSFGEWMSCHPECLGCAIPLLLQGIGNPEVAMPATMALKDVTRENLDHIKPYIQQILTACKSAIDRGNLKSRESIRIMACVGQVLSVLPFEDIMENLNPILTPHLQQLEQLTTQEPSASVKNGLLLKLNMLSWLFASLDTERDTGEAEEPKQQVKVKSTGPKPVFVILQQIAPMLRTIVSNWIMDAGVVEAICELFKRSLQTLMDDFAPLSKDIAELLVQMYQTIPHVSILDLTKQLIIMFNKDPEFSSVVKVLLESVCSRTLDLFQGDVRPYTDVVEAFMNLLAQVLKKTKDLLLEGSRNIAGLFQAGIVGMTLPENHTVKAASLFMNELLSLREVHSVQEVVNSQGQLLLDRIMRAIGGESPRMIMESTADVLFCLSKNYLEPLRVWFQEVISKDGYPSERCSKADKEQFVKSILRERVNKRRVREVVKEFSLLCRGLLGTEYAAQMANLM